MLINILLQAAGPSGMQNLVFLLLIIVIFYFFMIRPQMRKAKQEKEFRETLQKGTKVVTIGGIHGRIIEVATTTFLIEIDSNVKVRIEKSAVAADATKAINSNADSKNQPAAVTK
ncbi:MAG: preprotein translocase subunit YajC [Bacteroidota bacterium]|jgi:preprotein translocase subunit YajC